MISFIMTLFPIPNVLISVLIGITTETFIQVLVSSLGWGLIWIIYSAISKLIWIEDFIQKAISVKGWSYRKSKFIAFLSEYYSIALMTVLPLSSLVFFVKVFIIKILE